MSSLVAVDLETTGLYPQKGHHIIEIGAVRIAGAELGDEFSLLVECPIVPATIRRMTGITKRMLSKAAPLEQCLSRFRTFVGDSVLVAHNAKFDRRFLSNEYARLGWPFANTMECTLRLSREALPHLGDYRLERVAAEVLNSDHTGDMTHRALTDARLVGRIWLALHNIKHRSHQSEARDDG